MDNKRVMVIDGNSVINRAFYGLQGRGSMLTSADGTPTNAVYGFLNIVLKQIEDIKPDYLCVAFDLRAPTFRHTAYSEYKANRKGMPDDLAVQMPLLKDVLAAMNVAMYTKEGYEADDIIGTISSVASTKGMECYIVTGDRDSFQLINDKTCVCLLNNKNGCTPMREAEILKTYGVSPKQMIEVKGLMGDSSDNIPGVKGVGEKTALELIQTYGNIEGVYDALEGITKKALKQKLTDGKDMAFLSRKLGTIMCAVPELERSDLEEFAVAEPNREKLYEVFSTLGFKKMIERFGLGSGNGKEVGKAKASVPAKSGESENVITLFDLENDRLNRENATAFELPNGVERTLVKDAGTLMKFVAGVKKVCAGDGGNALFIVPIVKVEKGKAYVEKLGFYDGANCAYDVDAALFDEKCSDGQSLVVALKEVLSNSDIKKCGFSIKNFLLWALSKNIEVNGIVDDMEIAAYVLNPSGSDYTVEELYMAYKGENEPSVSYTILQESDKAYLMSKFVDGVRSKLSEIESLALYEEIEIPLINVLANMEYVGFKIDIEKLKEFGKELSEKIVQMETRIYEVAGEEFNINSPKQLGVILFEKLKLPAIKKTKTGYSTNAAVLEELKDSHEIVELILEYRKMAKLKSTYADGLLAAVDMDTGRLHSHFQQTVTATGRLSSTEPNLQNIPVRTEMGREIRKLFVADKENVLVDADYSQIELRVLAHMADDKVMREAFLQEKDIHIITASQVFGVPVEKVTSRLRSNAKAVNFGIVYGIGEFSLGKDLGISRADAGQYIKDYLKTYSGVDAFMKKMVEDAKNTGYAVTMLGRRRMIPEITASNFMTRSFGERVAMNAPVQGSAADIIKIAMIRVFNALRENGLRAKLILQVHDELIVEAPIEEQEKVENIVRKCMESAVALSVPLVADAKSGATWFETK